MNDDEATTLLDRLGAQITVGSPPIRGIFEGVRAKRHRRGLQVAGSAAVVFALAWGGYALRPAPGVEAAPPPGPTRSVTSGPTGGPSGPVTPPGSRLVGEGGVVVAVPASWTTNDIGCMGMVNSDTVTFNKLDGGAACSVGDFDASVLSVVDSSSPQWESRLRLTAEHGAIDGLQALRTPTICTTPGGRQTCSAVLTFPDRQVSFLVSSLDDRLVDGILDSAQRLPAGWVNVPDVRTKSAAEARQLLNAHGLPMASCRPGECDSYAIGTAPAAGTAVASGSTVSVTFYHRATVNGAERSTTSVDGLSIRVWLSQENVRSGHLLRSRTQIENTTTMTIRYDGCTTGNPRFGLQRVGSQQVDWRQGVVDCAGAIMLEPGFTSRWPGPGFVAKTSTGQPLAPGPYFALIDFGGNSPWIRYRVGVLPAR